eukprot:1151783-Pelagomonas_calceolata.AAC.3
MQINEHHSKVQGVKRGILVQSNFESKNIKFHNHTPPHTLKVSHLHSDASNVCAKPKEPEENMCSLLTTFPPPACPAAHTL